MFPPFRQARFSNMLTWSFCWHLALWMTMVVSMVWMWCTWASISLGCPLHLQKCALWCCQRQNHPMYRQNEGSIFAGQLDGFVARVRGDPPLLQSAMDILWRLRFSRLRQAPSRKAWYSRGPVKSKIIASYVHENFYLWYFILPQIMVFPCSINITARLACTNNHTCSTDSLARLIIGFKSTK